MAKNAARSDALADVYARSLFNLARELGDREPLERTSRELEALVEIAARDQAFNEFLRSVILRTADRARSLRAILENRISDLTLRFLLVLNANGRLAHLAAIATAFDELVQDAFGVVEVDVFSAQALDKHSLSAIEKSLRQSLGRDPALYAYVEPAMIGGIKLLIGDRLIDGSVRTQLRKLQTRLTTHGAAQVRGSADRFIQPS